MTTVNDLMRRIPGAPPPGTDRSAEAPTLCLSRGCPSARSCWRATAPSAGLRQRYGYFLGWRGCGSFALTRDEAACQEAACQEASS